MIHCVTTMSKEYYDRIGQVMIKTWQEFFPKEGYVLHLYLEDFSLDTNDDRIVIESWSDIQGFFESWKEKNTDVHPRLERFTKKALAQIAAWRKIKTGKLLWLDADIVFLKELPDGFFEKTLGNYPLASWGSVQFESGTVFIDIDHEDFIDIKNIYEQIYITDQKVPEGERWFDGELLGWACVQAGSKHRDLWCFCDAKTSTPLNRSFLGEYMQHFKANRKNNLKVELDQYYDRSDIANLLD